MTSFPGSNAPTVRSRALNPLSKAAALATFSRLPLFLIASTTFLIVVVLVSSPAPLLPICCVIAAAALSVIPAFRYGRSLIRSTSGAPLTTALRVSWISLNSLYSAALSLTNLAGLNDGPCSAICLTA